jgi:integrase/recombinase XerD
MLTIYRRHRRSCKHLAKGRKRRQCQCPIWVDGWLEGKQIRESLKLRDWQRAQEMIRDWEAEERHVVPPERKTLTDCWKEFLADVEARKLHESTIRKYRSLKRQMEGHAKKRAFLFLDEFDLPTVSQFRSEWKDGQRSSAKKLERLRACFSFAQKRRWVAENPASELKAPKITLCPTLPFNREEMVRILTAIDNYKEEIHERGSQNGLRLRELVFLLRYSGMRIGDAVSLTADRIEGNRLFLYTQKTGVAAEHDFPRVRDSRSRKNTKGHRETLLLGWSHQVRNRRGQLQETVGDFV